MKREFKSRLKGVIYSHLLYFKKIYGMYERFMIMYVPFISSIMYCISVICFYTKNYSPLYASYNANLSGHSIFWLQLVLSRSKNMCKWYKMSIIFSMLSHVINILYYHKIIGLAKYFSISLSIAIMSIITWLVFRITYRVGKIFCSENTHLREE